VLTEKKILRSFLPSAGGRLLEVQEDRDISLAGLLLGGCLDVLSHMPGTRFDSTQDIIKQNLPVLWVLEACDQNPFEIRRSLWQLRESGWFDTACGFLIGRPLAAFNCEIMGLNQYNAVTDILAPLQVPVIMDADIGHISPAMPLVLGTMAQAHIRGNEITVRYSELAKG
jgi:muramoyltetrapeptide carboxypeptidase LdcA involved in peptidoglycan recycling